MVQGFERAMREYESKLTAPYDKGGALYEEDEENDEQYWSNVDSQIEEYFLSEREG